MPGRRAPCRFESPRTVFEDKGRSSGSVEGPALTRGPALRVLAGSAPPYPLTAPAVRPATMWRWASTKTTIAGRMVKVMKARTSCQSVVYSPW